MRRRRSWALLGVVQGRGQGRGQGPQLWCSGHGDLPATAAAWVMLRLLPSQQRQVIWRVKLPGVGCGVSLVLVLGLGLGLIALMPAWLPHRLLMALKLRGSCQGGWPSIGHCGSWRCCPAAQAQLSDSVSHS